MKYTVAKEFAKLIWFFYKKNKRDLSWRKTSDPYKILISEVMLQQTQVSRIIPKYESFLKKFPDFKSLAKASLSEVLLEWKGIGYNRRAMWLKTTAEIIVKKYKGVLPDDPEILVALPGIGKATAASIVVYSFNKPVVFIETNVRRVFIHHFFQNKEDVNDKDIIPLIEKELDRKNPKEWYWALMDYGSYLAKQVPNPNRKSKHYVKQSKFEGSSRQLRARVLHYVVELQKVEKNKLEKLFEDDRLDDVLQQLVSEKFLAESNGVYKVQS